MSLLHKPQHVWFRKALFQVHLWAGLLFGLYMLAIGASGAILVFQDELTPAPKFTLAAKLAVAPALPAIVGRVHSAYPKVQLEEILLPAEDRSYYLAYLKSGSGRYFAAYLNPTTGQIAQDPAPRWLDVVSDLHFNLLMGDRGLILNGIGAAALLLLCMSGLVIWWPGASRWRRALTVNFRGNWKRINWDLHSAVGFWTLLFLSLWALSGVYFAWPQAFSAGVNRISSVSAALPPKFVVPPRRQTTWPSLDTLIHQVQCSSPHTQLSGIDFPDSDKDALIVLMARSAVGDFTRMDFFYLDPSTGQQLALWHRGVNPTLGSKLVFWLAPLHFGTQWGLPVKIIWAGCGLGLPLLFLTGAIMFWNRSLRKKWKAINNLTRRDD